MSGEQLNNNSETTGNGSINPWQETMRDVPPFGSAEQQENKETEKSVSERSVAEQMLNVVTDEQDTYIDYLKQLKAENLSDEAEKAYQKFLDGSIGADRPEMRDAWREELNSQLDRLARIDECIVQGIEDLERPENAGKTLEEIFTARAEQTQKRLKTLSASGALEKMSDEEIDNLVSRRNEYENLADWAPYVRKGLKNDMNEEPDSSENSEEILDKIDIDTKVENLQAEIQKRQNSLEYYKTQDQRNYGNDVLRMSVLLNQKQADLHVLKMIQLAGHSQSEDNMVTPEDATATIEKYISDRQVYFDNLTRQREQYEKRSAEYREITKNRGKWWREMEAAKRVAEQLGLNVEIEDEE